MERPGAVYGSQFLWRRLVAISVPLALLAMLGVSYAILSYRWPEEPCTYHLGRQGSSSHVAPTNTFVKFGHYSGALVAAYARQDRVRKPMPEQYPIHQGVPGGVPLSLLALLWLCWEDPIR